MISEPPARTVPSEVWRIILSANNDGTPEMPSEHCIPSESVLNFAAVGGHERDITYDSERWNSEWRKAKDAHLQALKADEIRLSSGNATQASDALLSASSLARLQELNDAKFGISPAHRLWVKNFVKSPDGIKAQQAAIEFDIASQMLWQFTHESPQHLALFCGTALRDLRDLAERA